MFVLGIIFFFYRKINLNIESNSIYEYFDDNFITN